MSRDRAYFLIRKLHSLTGIIPIGAFLFAHLFINSGALLGECSFTDGVRSVNGLPYLPYIEIFGILMPIVFHGLLGLWMVLVEARYNPLSYNYSRNWWYTFQRFSGLVLLGFLTWHLWDLVLAKVLGQLHLEDFYGHLGTGMGGSQLYLAVFVLGTLAASFHLSNGLWGFCASWGIVQSRKAQRIGSWIFSVVGLVMFIGWFNIIFHFATGGMNVISVQEPPVECEAAQFSPSEG